MHPHNEAVCYRHDVFSRYRNILLTLQFYAIAKRSVDFVIDLFTPHMTLEYEQRMDECDSQGLSQSRAIIIIIIIIIFMKHDICDLTRTCSKIKGSKNTRETSY